MSCYDTANSAADKARADYEYEFGEQDRAGYEGYEQEERRDYNAEAHSIAAGESMMLAEKGHVAALAYEIDALERTVAGLKKQNEMLREAFAAEAAKNGSPYARKPTASEVAA
jgi:hypothetical protein